MSSRKLIIQLFSLSLMFVLLPDISLAQDDEIRNIWRWFPDENYSSLQFHSNAAIKRANAEDIYILSKQHKVLFAFFDFLKDPLPKELQSWEWRAEGRIASFEITIASEKQLADKKKYKPLGGQIDEYGGKNYFTRWTGGRMIVYSFSDISSLIIKLKEKNLIRSLEKKLYDLPVYKLSGSEKDYFLYATGCGHLLVAENIFLLQAMNESSFGSPSILDSDKYTTLWEILPQLGQYWFLSDPRAETREQIRIAVEAGDEKRLESSRTFLEKGNYLVGSFNFGKRVTRSLVFVFPNVEIAREFLSRRKQRLNQYKTQLQEGNNDDKTYLLREVARKYRIDSCSVFSEEFYSLKEMEKLVEKFNKSKSLKKM